MGNGKNQSAIREINKSKIMTVFFKAKKIFGGEKAFDDIVEVKWFDVSTFNLDNLVKGHRPLFENLLINLKFS